MSQRRLKDVMSCVLFHSFFLNVWKNSMRVCTKSLLIYILSLILTSNSFPYTKKKYSLVQQSAQNTKIVSNVFWGEMDHWLIVTVHHVLTLIFKWSMRRYKDCVDFKLTRAASMSTITTQVGIHLLLSENVSIILYF